MTRTPAGERSVSVTPVARDGPLLTTVTCQRTSWPAAGVPATPVTATARSACAVTGAVAVAASLSASGSDRRLPDVPAIVSGAPTASAGTATVTSTVAEAPTASVP